MHACVPAAQIRLGALGCATDTQKKQAGVMEHARSLIILRDYHSPIMLVA
jgi:hypothetical protein